MKICHENIGVRFHHTRQFSGPCLQLQDMTQCKGTNRKVKDSSVKRKLQAIGLCQPTS